MEQQITNYIFNHGFTYVPIPSEHIETVHNLFFKNIIPQVDVGIVLLYCGVYCRINKDYSYMVKYYSMAIRNGYFRAMKNLIAYPNWLTPAEMTELCLVCADHGHIDSMIGLAKMYKLQQDYDNADCV